MKNVTPSNLDSYKVLMYHFNPFIFINIRLNYNLTKAILLKELTKVFIIMP